MKVTIARLRSNVKYNRPLETVLDSFFENYVKWQRSRTDLQYDVYNVSFTNQRPVRNPEAIKNADVIVIPSDSEFRYHGELQMNPKDLAKSESYMDEIRPFFKGKKIIIWRSDRGDTEELYRKGTFKGIELKSVDVIDEIDFSGNIHGMKYHFLQQEFHNPISNLSGWTLPFDVKKTVDFGYWGRMKSGENERNQMIKQIYRKDDISTMLIGGFPAGVKRNAGWMKNWKTLYPMLEPCKTTLCFNWIDETATTSRYPEALSIGIIPFVWKKYDSSNTYNIHPWQRIYSFDEFYSKLLQLKDNSFFNDRLEEYRDSYKEVLLSEKEYSEQFSERMNDIIDG